MSIMFLNSALDLFNVKHTAKAFGIHKPHISILPRFDFPTPISVDECCHDASSFSSLHLPYDRVSPVGKH